MHKSNQEFERMNSTQATVQQLKTPPHSIEAEWAVIGGLLLDCEKLYDVTDILSPDDFYHLLHKDYFSAMIALSEKSQKFDLITVCDYLSKQKRVIEAGDLANLAEMMHMTPSSANVVAYAKIIVNMAVNRRILSASQTIAGSVFEKSYSTEQRIEIAETAIMGVRTEMRSEVKDANTVIAKTLQELVDMEKEVEEGAGVFAGLKSLDARINGFRKSDLVVIAGRPSMGKTVLALNIAAENAVIKSKPVLFFSLEMSAEQLMQRMFSSFGEVRMDKIMNPKTFEKEDWQRLSNGITRLRDKPLYIDDTAGISISELRAKARRQKRITPDLALIVVDYLQLMSGDGDGREQEIASISRGLKKLAKELKLPIIALSQLNRGLESRPDKRPIMSDLRESGAIEQDADIVMFLYRDEVYSDFSPEKGAAHIITRKFRNGKIGTDYVAEQFVHSRFVDLKNSPEKFSDYGQKKVSGNFKNTFEY